MVYYNSFLFWFSCIHWKEGYDLSPIMWLRQGLECIRNILGIQTCPQNEGDQQAIHLVKKKKKIYLYSLHGNFVCS